MHSYGKGSLLHPFDQYSLLFLILWSINYMKSFRGCLCFSGWMVSTSMQAHCHKCAVSAYIQQKWPLRTYTDIYRVFCDKSNIFFANTIAICYVNAVFAIAVYLGSTYTLIYTWSTNWHNESLCFKMLLGKEFCHS